MTNGFQTYLVSYRHEGEEWTLELLASSAEDARQRLSKLVFGRVDGVLFAKLPANLGPLASLIVRLRNLLA